MPVTHFVRDKAPLSARVAAETTDMAAVGFCGDWFIFSGDTKLVAVHSAETRSERRFTFPPRSVRCSRLFAVFAEAWRKRARFQAECFVKV